MLFQVTQVTPTGEENLFIGELNEVKHKLEELDEWYQELCSNPTSQASDGGLLNSVLDAGFSGIDRINSPDLNHIIENNDPYENQDHPIWVNHI